MAILGMRYNKSCRVVVPDDVVQWRVRVIPEDVAVIYMARGDGSLEEWYLEERRSGTLPGELWYEPGQQVRLEKEGSDASTVFIDWEGVFPDE